MSESRMLQLGIALTRRMELRSCHPEYCAFVEKNTPRFCEAENGFRDIELADLDTCSDWRCIGGLRTWGSGVALEAPLTTAPDSNFETLRVD
jgi:hypothetical protein